MFTGTNRARHRADAANKAKPVPKSIWLITRVVRGMQLHTGTPL